MIVSYGSNRTSRLDHLLSASSEGKTVVIARSTYYIMVFFIRSACSASRRKSLAALPMAKPRMKATAAIRIVIILVKMSVPSLGADGLKEEVTRLIRFKLDNNFIIHHFPVFHGEPL